jgi:hypothetical protein
LDTFPKVRATLHLFRNVHVQLPRSAPARKEHIARLRQILDDESHKSLFDHLYASLSILDSKSASLLQFNSVLAAVFTLYVQGEKIPLSHYIVGVVGIIAALVSCYRLLTVLWVHWSTEDHMKTVEAHSDTLLRVRAERTLGYRIAWNWSKGAVLALFLLVGLALFERVRLLGS